MKAAPFQYFLPKSINETLNLMTQNSDYCLLAGGQSLMPMLNFRAFQPSTIIDLNNISELTGIKVDVENKKVHIGAMTRQRELEFSTVIQKNIQIISTAIKFVGHRQTRNRGTIGGSLCHLDPSAELLLIASLLDVKLNVQSINGTREISISQWCDGYLTNTLQPGELLTSISFPIRDSDTTSGFCEFSRRHGDFAIVGSAAQLTFDQKNFVTKAAIAIGGCSESPQRLVEIEKKLIGCQLNETIIKSISQLALNVEATSDTFIKADYRRHLARVLTQRALTQALKDRTSC